MRPTEHGTRRFGCKLPDQVRQVAVVRGAAGFGTQDRDGVVRDPVPFAEEGPRPGIEEDEPRVVRGPFGFRVDGCEQRPSELVRGDDVQPAVEHHRGCEAHRVDHPLDGGPDPLGVDGRRRRVCLGVLAVRIRSSR